MNDLTPKQINDLGKLAELIDGGEVAVLKEINDLSDRIDGATEIASNALKIASETSKVEVQGIQGDKGERGEKGENGRDGKDGLDGKNGKDGRDGRDGRDGLDGVDGNDGKDGKDGDIKELSPQEIRDSLELLNGDERLDAKYIKNLPKSEQRTIIGGGGSSQVYHDSTLSGTGSQSSPLSVVDSGGSSGGILPVTISGTIDDSNTTFTAPNDFTFLVMNGGVYKKTGGAITWTYTAGTVEVSSPVGDGGSIYGLQSSVVETKCVSVGYENPTASDIVSFILIPANITITEVSGSTDSGTFTVGLQYRPRNAKNATGTNILTTAIVLDSDGATTTTFTNASVPADYYLTLVAAGTTGTVGDFILNVKYIID